MQTAKPILVTGGTGCIGSVLVRRLCQAGQRVRIVVRSPERAGKLRDLDNIEMFQGDLSRPASLYGCAAGCSLVYHCAAKVSGSDWAAAYASNLTGTQAIVDEALQAGAERLIYTSTIGVYGLTRAETITEETPWAPYKMPYFTTKQQAERIVAHAAGQIPVAIARVGDVIGPDQYSWTINLIQQLEKGILIPPLPSQSGNLNPVYIDNLVDALLLMGEHPAAAGQVFNVVDGTPMLFTAFFQRMAQIAGKRITPLPSILLKAGAAFLAASDRLRGREALVSPGVLDYLLRKGLIYPQKLHTTLGWSPAVSLEEAFRRIEQWLHSRG